jgi:XTP/dITP diphosphohydrolase
MNAVRIIYFATKNKGKFVSLSNALSSYHIGLLKFPIDLPEPRTDDVRKIARDKVLFAYNRIKKPCIALDAGFYIDALNGFPKAFVNFALETIKLEGILKLVEDKPRDCEFRQSLAYLDDKLSEPEYFESINRGKIAEEPRGLEQDYHWSELSLIFIPEGETKTLAEMNKEEYQAWRKRRQSHSYETKFKDWILRYRKE